LPLPNIVAIGGEALKNVCLEGGYPKKCLVEVEALRYLEFNEDNHSKSGVHSIRSELQRVLVIGDYLSSNTSMQMNLLNQISEKLERFDLTVKPHPACPVEYEDYPKLKFTLSDRPISELAKKFDIAYTTNLTSAVLDAYSAGLKIISVLDPASLNLSPMRGISGIRFVSSSLDLHYALVEAQSLDYKDFKRVKFFYADPTLTRWRALLSNNRNNSHSNL